MTWQEIIDIVKTKEHKSVEGKISCSSLPVLKLCGGSLKAQRKVKKISKKYDQEGSALHYIMEHEVIVEDISEENREKIGRANSLLRHFSKEGWDAVYNEDFLEGEWLCGTPDMILKKDNDYLVIDWKFGSQYVANVTPQIAGYAWLVASKFEHDNVYTCVVNINSDSVDMLDNDMVEISQEILSIKENGEIGNRTPSAEACQFCSACGTFACPETQEISHELAKPELNGEISVSNLEKYAPMLPVMKKAVKGFEDQLKKHLETNEMDGVAIKEG